jgi:hypothetical protein
MAAVPLRLDTPPPVVDPCAKILADDAKLSRLAMEFARDLIPAAQILGSYEISADDFNDKIKDNPVFMRFYAEHAAIWKAETSTALRFTMKAGAIAEDWLKEAHILLHDRSQPLTAKVDLAKKLMDVAGFSEVHSPKGNGAGGGGQTTVVINLGHGREQIRITKDVVEVPDEVPVQVLDMQTPTPLPPQVTSPQSEQSFPLPRRI